jgi:hypothetical protein
MVIVGAFLIGTGLTGISYFGISLYKKRNEKNT